MTQQDTQANFVYRAMVIRQKADNLGNLLGKAHQNPLLITREYEVKLEDGSYDLYFTNMIAETYTVNVTPRDTSSTLSMISLGIKQIATLSGKTKNNLTAKAPNKRSVP